MKRAPLRTTVNIPPDLDGIVAVNIAVAPGDAEAVMLGFMNRAGDTLGVILSPAMADALRRNLNRMHKASRAPAGGADAAID